MNYENYTQITTDHDVYEKEMIDMVNRHAEDKSQNSTPQSTVVAKTKVFTKRDVISLGRGLKRMIIALITAFLFALSVFSFFLVAKAPGYWAVVVFFGAVVLLIVAFTLLYAQGIVPDERKGDDK